MPVRQLFERRIHVPFITLPGHDWRPGFHAQLNSLVARLNRLLNITGPVGTRYQGVPIRRIAPEAREAISNGDRELAETDILLIGKLVEDLERVRAFNTKLFKAYRKRLEKSDEATYRGTRFEIGTASAFIKHDVPFSIPVRSHAPSPDFLVSSPTGICTVECTVRQTENSEDTDLFYKLTAAISAKGGKAYVGSDTVLFIEVTDLLYARMNRNNLFHRPRLREDVSEALETTSFGGVLLFYYILENSLVAGRQYSRVYIRCDNSSMGKSAAWLLDGFFPRGERQALVDSAIPFTP
jgi:hypothetical protein